MKISNAQGRSSFEEYVKDMGVPHIYKVRNDFYYLGQMICRKCTIEEIEAYQKLMNEYKRLKSFDYDLEKSDCKVLIEYYSQVIAIEVDGYDESKYRKVMHARCDLLFDIDSIILTELIEQYYTYKEIMDWNQGKLNRQFSYK